jgi:leucyl-tRNA synthetase
VLKDGSKMSKSVGNTVDPQDLMDKYGADTVRLFLMFAAPPEQSLEWSDAGVEGSYRFLKRLWSFATLFCLKNPTLVAQDNRSNNLSSDKILTDKQKDLKRLIHHTIQRVTHDYAERYTFNTVIAALMELLNALYKADSESIEDNHLLREGIENIVLMISPIAPHIAHALWLELGHTSAIIEADWPAIEFSALIQDNLELVIQVNGKVRGKLTIAAEADDALIQHAALKEESVLRFIDGKPIKKVIIVPKKLINIVV